MSQAFTGTLRVHRGAVRFGGSAGVRLADADDHIAVVPAALAGWQLTDPGGALPLEATAEIGANLAWAKPRLEDGRIAHGRELLWTPMAAAQLAAGWRFGSRLEIVVGGRLEARYPREVERDTLFCGFRCEDVANATWRLGGVNAGGTFAIRGLLW